MFIASLVAAVVVWSWLLWGVFVRIRKHELDELRAAAGGAKLRAAQFELDLRDYRSARTTGIPDRKAHAARLAVERWGERSQLDQLQEECSELAAAVSHHRRRRISGDAALLHEIADVEIMVAQARVIFGNEAVDHAVAHKLDRLDRKLEGWG